MEDLNILLDPASPTSLQHQLRQKLIDAIYSGVLRPGQRLPSTRNLARRINVSRNTISLAYDALIAEGHLDSRPRSGIYVAREVAGAHVATGRREHHNGALFTSRMRSREPSSGFQLPGNWSQYPYPFIDGCGDLALLPVDEWREAMRLACTRHELSRAWQGPGDNRNLTLVEEVRTKVLPTNGIVAGADEVLVTQSARHALQLLADLLIQRGTPVLLEEPADESLGNWLAQNQVPTATLDPALPAPLPQRAVVFTGARRSPLFQRPEPRRLLEVVTAADGIIIEHAMLPGMFDEAATTSALRAMDSSGRVIHVGSLASWLSCDNPLGLVVAAAPLIERLRQSQRALGTVPSTVVQTGWAYFISLGHYSASLGRARRVLERRKTALRDALNHYLHKSVSITTVPGASAYWVKLKDDTGMSALELAQRAAKIGVLMEPMQLPSGESALCMGVTSLDEPRIRAGVKALSRLLRGDLAATPASLRDESIAPLRGDSLARAMSGVRLVYTTVYGEPCTLELLADGQLQGVAGHAGEDCDRGRWWIEEDRWFRQWEHWAYGEVSGYSVVVDGDQVRWYDQQGLLADVAVIIRGAGNPPGPLEPGSEARGKLVP